MREFDREVGAPGEVAVVAGLVVGGRRGAGVLGLDQLVARGGAAASGARPEVAVVQFDAQGLAGALLSGRRDDLEPAVRGRQRERRVRAAGGARAGSVADLIRRIPERRDAGTGAALAAAMDGAVLLQVVAGEIGGPADVGADRAAGECKTKDYTNSGKDPQGWLRRGRTEP